MTQQADPTTTKDAARALPLHGIVVLDLGQIYNGPYASFLMAMSGARVIKIEPPAGENMRRRAGVSSGAALPFAMLNSNKEFVTINLKTGEGKSALMKMVEKADVLIENYTPGTMERLGVGPARLLDINPKLVYAAGSGYGSTGPYKHYLAMDLTVQAMSGVMACTGYPDQPPVKSGAALADFFGAVHLYAAAVTALFDAQRTGSGRYVEAAMLESVYPALSSPLSMYYGLGGENPPRTGNRHNGLAEAPYNVYPANDGWIALFCVTEAHFAGLAAAMDRPELMDDPKYSNLKQRVENMDALDELIGEWTQGKSKLELSELASRYRVPFAPVRELDEVVNDTHMHERGSLQRVVHPDFGEVVLPAGALRYAGAKPPTLEPSKAAGADNERIFKDWLGLSSTEFDALMQGSSAIKP